jgi:hypothetical protein
LRIRVTHGLLGRKHQKNGGNDGFIPVLPGEYNACQDALGWIEIDRSIGDKAYLNHSKFEHHIVPKAIVVLAV